MHQAFGMSRYQHLLQIVFDFLWREISPVTCPNDSSVTFVTTKFVESVAFLELLKIPSEKER